MLRQVLGPAAAIGGLALGVVAALLRTLPAEPPPIQIEVPTAAPSPVPPFIVVHVSGAVWRPGLVKVRQGARVADVVAEAGGLRSDALPEAVNLARRVRDEEHLHVPSYGQVDAARPAVGPDPGPVDLNAATARELEALPGIGPALAERILAHRERVGAFLTVEELLEVRGIGPSLLEQLEGLVAVY